MRDRATVEAEVEIAEEDYRLIQKEFQRCLILLENLEIELVTIIANEEEGRNDRAG
jgi:hypothetical protein